MKKILLIVLCFLLLFNCHSFRQFNTRDVPLSNEVLKKEHDKFKGITWYKHRGFYYSIYGSGSYSRPIRIYVGCYGSGHIFKRIVFTYLDYGSGWIFFDKVILLNSKAERMYFDINTYDKYTSVSSGVKEEIDILLGEKQIEELLNFLKDETEISLRLSGKYNEDYIFYEGYIKALIRMLKFNKDNLF